MTFTSWVLAEKQEQKTNWNQYDEGIEFETKYLDNALEIFCYRKKQRNRVIAGE